MCVATDEKYMRRCLQLAANGKGEVSPNPMVGAVIVHAGRIIGEGYHRACGKAHAEVNAINAVKDKMLLRESTLYVSLEPCSHHGKTPPCSQLILDNGIARVVVACLDPYPRVAGKGVAMLRQEGIEVSIGVLEKEALMLNKEFITAQTQKRPYVYLKWAQTQDGFIDKKRDAIFVPVSTPISNDFTMMLVHKLRAEVASIFVGTNTVLNDNPSLTTRLWYGSNPVRVVIDRLGRMSQHSNVLDNKAKTIVFTENTEAFVASPHVHIERVVFDGSQLNKILKKLHTLHIDSVMIEGGRQLLQSLIDQDLWDEAFVEISPTFFYEGVRAPKINGELISEHKWKSSNKLHWGNDARNYKII